MVHTRTHLRDESPSSVGVSAAEPATRRSPPSLALAHPWRLTVRGPDAREGHSHEIHAVRGVSRNQRTAHMMRVIALSRPAQEVPPWLA